MHGDVVRLIALDLVLRIVLARVMGVTLVVHIPRMHPNDMASDPASFGIPGYVISTLESLCHELMLVHLVGIVPAATASM